MEFIQTRGTRMLPEAKVALALAQVELRRQPVLAYSARSSFVEAGMAGRVTRARLVWSRRTSGAHGLTRPTLRFLRES